jgi:hypothetical protein
MIVSLKSLHLQLAYQQINLVELKILRSESSE